LAFVWRFRDQLDVNAELVRRGLAKVYHTQYRCSRTEEFATVEKEAREAKRGLWGDGDTTTAKDKPRDGERTQSDPNDRGVSEVYITNSGQKYHASGCRFLAKSKIAVSLEEAKRKGFEPCKVCNPPR